MTCRTCRWLNVEPDSAGRVRPHKMKVYDCVVEIPMPPLPTSVTVNYGFAWPPRRNWVSPEDGEACPMYEKRK